MIVSASEYRCPGCMDTIQEGDPIGLIEGEWVCAECVEAFGGEDPEPTELAA